MIHIVNEMLLNEMNLSHIIGLYEWVYPSCTIISDPSQSTATTYLTIISFLLYSNILVCHILYGEFQ
jgi:hypothetical protein